MGFKGSGVKWEAVYDQMIQPNVTRGHGNFGEVPEQPIEAVTITIVNLVPTMSSNPTLAIEKISFTLKHTIVFLFTEYATLV